MTLQIFTQLEATVALSILKSITTTMASACAADCRDVILLLLSRSCVRHAPHSSLGFPLHEALEPYRTEQTY